jgi:hypothetical protein
LTPYHHKGVYEKVSVGEFVQVTKDFVTDLVTIDEKLEKWIDEEHKNKVLSVLF